MLTNWKTSPSQEFGVICACDANQEWLLPWWWKRYRFYNDYPVLFCDYGMSEKAKAWCRERGQLISIPFDDNWIRPKKEIPFSLQKKWPTLNKNCWSSRSAWFKKPFALLHSPFKKSIFLDLDCEVLSYLGPLYEFCTDKTPLVISSCGVPVFSQMFPCETAHNGGVIVFSHGIDIFSELAEWVLKWNHQFFAEDNILSYLIFKNKYPTYDLPREWNWICAYGVNVFARIFHWHSTSKDSLKIHEGIKPFKDALERGVVCEQHSSALILASELGFAL